MIQIITTYIWESPSFVSETFNLFCLFRGLGWFRGEGPRTHTRFGFLTCGLGIGVRNRSRCFCLVCQALEFSCRSLSATNSHEVLIIVVVVATMSTAIVVLVAFIVVVLVIIMVAAIHASLKHDSTHPLKFEHPQTPATLSNFLNCIPNRTYKPKIQTIKKDLKP